MEGIQERSWHLEVQGDLPGHEGVEILKSLSPQHSKGGACGNL
jgi:hypothetical protein